MNISAILGSPLLGLVKWAVPQSASVINFLQSHQQVIADAAPVIEAAVQEGRPAFEAAVKQAPKFAEAVQKFFVTHAPAVQATTAGRQNLMFENITRQFVGIHRMSDEEEKAWMDRATPGNDPSQDNSRMGSG